MVGTRCDRPNKRDEILGALGAMKWLNTLQLQQFRDFDLETANAIAQVLPQQLTRFALTDGRAKRPAAPYWMAPAAPSAAEIKEQKARKEVSAAVLRAAVASGQMETLSLGGLDEDCCTIALDGNLAALKILYIKDCPLNDAVFDAAAGGLVKLNILELDNIKLTEKTGGKLALALEAGLVANKLSLRMIARCPAQLANETHFTRIMHAVRDSTITVLKLERLSFSGAENDVIAAELAASLPCSCVTTLSLAYSSMMLDGTLKGDGCLKLAQCFSHSKIKRLDLSTCFEPSHADRNTGPMVQNSNARINHVRQELWDGISSDGSCVEHLNLNGNAAIRFDKLIDVALMKGLRSGGLKELQLSDNFANTFNDAGKELVHATRDIDNHPKVLDITQCTRLSKGNSELGNALGNSQLISLALHGRHGFPQVAVQAMLTALPGLSTMAVSPGTARLH